MLFYKFDKCPAKLLLNIAQYELWECLLLENVKKQSKTGQLTETHSVPSESTGIARVCRSGGCLRSSNSTGIFVVVHEEATGTVDLVRFPFFFFGWSCGDPLKSGVNRTKLRYFSNRTQVRGCTEASGTC